MGFHVCVMGDVKGRFRGVLRGGGHSEGGNGKICAEARDKARGKASLASCKEIDREEAGLHHEFLLKEIVRIGLFVRSAIVHVKRADESFMFSRICSRSLRALHMSQQRNGILEWSVLAP